MEVSYYKDYRHNYLIIKSVDFPTDYYQCRMITGNRIEGLLPCQERHINGDMLLYYEITSKQSLKSLYEMKRVTPEQLNKLFMQLKMVEEGISRFLLNESNLVLKPEYIFADVETEEISFLYYPFETKENDMVSFLEFLADRIDSENSDAAEIVYKMLELAVKEQFVLDEVLQWFEDDHVYAGKAYEEKPENLLQEPEEEEELSIQESFENGEEKTERNCKTAVVSMFLTAVSECVFYYIYITYQLSEKQQICIFAGFLLAGALFLVSGGYYLYKKIFKGQGGKGVISKNKSAGLRVPDKKDEEAYRDNNLICERVLEKVDQSYGNTVFIPWIENRENKLYGIGKGNKNHIDLSKLPLTVGKLAGSVDMVIEEPSISRMHVKFFKEGNRIYMSDLNSTNGTFKNGLRLQPNDSEMLEPGDEIRLGKLKFIYR